MPIARLTEAEVQALLAAHPGWSLRPDGLAIVRSLRFKDFVEAFELVSGSIVAWARLPVPHAITSQLPV